MRYLDAYKYIFNAPSWFTTLLLGAVSGFVPIVGPMAFSGYLYELEEAMCRTRDERPRDVDFNRLAAYLMRGLWPFLVALVAGLPLGILLAILLFVAVFGMMAVFASISPELALVGLLLGYVLGILLSIVLGCLLNVILIPMMLRSAYHMDFAAGFDMAFVKDFLRRVGKELILAQLFLGFTAAVLVFIGLMLCFVGIYAVGPIIQLAQIHLVYQLQRLYEERGGIPLVWKPHEGDRRSGGPPPGWRDDRDDFYPDDRGRRGDPGIQRRETGFQE